MTFTLRHIRRGGAGLAALALLGTAFIAPFDRAAPATAATPAATTPGGVSSGLVLWLDASNPNGDGTTPTAGSEVTTWQDLSVEGKDATVNPNGVGGSNTGAFFETTPTGFNDQPALRFDRRGDKLGSVYQTAGLDLRASTRPDVTVMTVYQQRGSGVEELHGVWGIDNGDWDRFFITRLDSPNGLVALGPVAQPGTNPPLFGQPVTGSGTPGETKLMTVAYSGKVVEDENVGDPNASFVYYDCKLEKSFTDTTSAENAKLTFSVGWDGDTSAFDGYIAEVIVYDRVLTTPELEDVSIYLAGKYGLGGGCADLGCDLTGARTLSQGGWSNKSTSSPMTDTWFDDEIGTDLVIGGADRSVTLSSAANTRRFLPQSGTPSVLRSTVTNPTRTQVKNTLAGQATALTLNLALSPGMANATLMNGYLGTVADLLGEVNAALNGTGNPSKSYLSRLNSHADYVNLSFPQGIDQLRLTCGAD